MSMIPLYDNVIVQLVAAEEVTKGGIHLPVTAVKKDEVVATVVAIGEGKLLSTGKIVPLKVDVGDHVILDQFSGTKFSYNKEKYTAVSADDIIVVIR